MSATAGAPLERYYYTGKSTNSNLQYGKSVTVYLTIKTDT